MPSPARASTSVDASSSAAPAAHLPSGQLTPLLQLEGATIGAGPAAVSTIASTAGLVGLAFDLFRRRDVTP